MTTQVKLAESFVKELKRLTRKYRSAADAVDELILLLKHNDRPGALMAGLGQKVYKVRVPKQSARRGKSGGFRVIYLEHDETLVFLLVIYSKTESSDIPNEVLRRLIDELD